jgi:hypothetical protein
LQLPDSRKDVFRRPAPARLSQTLGIDCKGFCPLFASAALKNIERIKQPAERGQVSQQDIEILKHFARRGLLAK